MKDYISFFCKDKKMRFFYIFQRDPIFFDFVLRLFQSFEIPKKSVYILINKKNNQSSASFCKKRPNRQFKT